MKRAAPPALDVVSLEDVDALGARVAGYCDDVSYGLQVVKGSDEILPGGYNTIYAREICGFDDDWLVKVETRRTQACAAGDGTFRAPVGLGDDDEGSFSSPVDSLLMTQDELTDEGFTLFGVPPDGATVTYPDESACGLSPIYRVPYSYTIYPVLLGPDGTYQRQGSRFEIMGTVDQPTLLNSFGGPALTVFRGDLDAPVRAEVFSAVSGKKRRYYHAVPVRVSVFADAASLGGLCLGAGCPAAGSTLDATWGDVQAGRVQYVPIQPWGEGTPPPGHDRQPEGLTFEVLGGHAPNPRDVRVRFAHDYQYRVDLSADEVAYGDSVRLTLVPFVEMEDGTVLDVDPFSIFLVDRMIVTAGYTTFHESAAPPLVASATLGDPAPTDAAKAASAFGSRTTPQNPHAELVPPDEVDDQCAWGPNGPESFPLRFSGAALSEDIDGPGPWTGLWIDYYDYGCKTTALDVPYGAAMEGEVWLVADGFEPAEDDSVVVEVRVESNNEASGATYHRGTALLTVRSGVDRALTVIATPDTLRAGEETQFSVDGPGLDPDTPVTFSVTDLSVGGLVVEGDAARTVGGTSADGNRQLSVTRALSAVGEVRFLAAETAPDSAVTVMVSVEAGGRSGEAEVAVLPEVAVRLIQQNDSAYVRRTLMVSRFSAGSDLPVSAPFNSSSASAGRPSWYDPFTRPRNLGPEGAGISFDAVDAYTIRPEVSADEVAAPTGATVAFRVRVRSQGSERSWDFPAIEGSVDGVRTYRADRHLRFVATAYDDAEGTAVPDQTPLVELGDSVLFSVIVNGIERDDPLALRVARPPSTGDVGGVDLSVEAELVERVGTLNWLWHDEAEDVRPTLLAQRMSERWAQAAVRFENRLTDAATDSAWGAVDFEKVQNVMFLRYPLVRSYLIGRRGTQEARRAGEFRVAGTVGGTRREARVSFAEGDSIFDTVQEVIQAVEREFGVPVVWFQDADDNEENSARFVDLEAADRFYIVVGDARSPEVILEKQNESVEADVSRERLDRDIRLHHAAGLVAARGDGDLATIEVVVIKDGSLQNSDDREVLGKGIGALTNSTLCLRREPGVGCELYNPLVNTVLVYDEHVDTDPDWSAVLPHEIGHVLFGAGHPAQYDGSGLLIVNDVAGSLFFRSGAPYLEHLLFGTAEEDAGADRQRRLDWNYISRARLLGAAARGGAILR